MASARIQTPVASWWNLTELCSLCLTIHYHWLTKIKQLKIYGCWSSERGSMRMCVNDTYCGGITTSEGRDAHDVSPHTLWIAGRGQKKKKRKWKKVMLRGHHTHQHTHALSLSLLLICQSNKGRQARAAFAWQTGPARLIEEKTILGDRLTVWCGACHLWVGLRTHNRSVCVRVGGWLIYLWVCVAGWSMRW